MNRYVIGDVQGCWPALERLLQALDYSRGRDQLLFAGDLVNRGPDSLAVLRFAREHAAVAVLGNHDLHLLARAHGRPAGRRDTLEAVLNAPDRDALLDWLRHCPLLHEEPGWCLSHAGIAPEWSLPVARSAARAVEAELRRADIRGFLDTMYGNEPRRWADAHSEGERWRFTVNAFTRMRYCAADGALDLDQKGRPGTQPPNLFPWFACPRRVPIATRSVFGHWSTLGTVQWPEHAVWGLDTGAVWGGLLTALHLESGRLVQVACPENARPGLHDPD